MRIGLATPQRAQSGKEGDEPETSAWERPTVAVAESATGGLVMGRIVRTPDSGAWFKGGVVAYHTTVKQSLLGVAPGPMVAERAVREMARGVRDLLDADIGIATSGVAGPESVEGQPVGTIYIGWSTTGPSDVLHVKLEGDPDQIREQAVDLTFRQMKRARALFRKQN
ncbi:MAG TPA: CinA family protein [Acidimicrobiia bacterium]|nr:CinA family protein [Acidimicrobiia bacterium]